MEAISGLPKLPFRMGTFHYDEVPPDDLGGPASDTADGHADADADADADAGSVVGRLEELRLADRFRFANHLEAWIEVVDGRIVDAGYGGEGRIGATRVKLGGAAWFVTAVALPDRRSEPEWGDGWVRFSQTAGGRTGVPAPRTVRRPPFVQWRAPIAWTTLTLTVHADGRNDSELTGASPFPRHWVYDTDGRLASKSGLTDFKHWWKRAFGRNTPWGSLDSKAFVTEIETALERTLSAQLLAPGCQARFRRLKAGDRLVEQGKPGDSMFVVMDGVVAVDVDGHLLAELGPGAVLGERAILEHGLRTSTVSAVTACRVAEIGAGDLTREQLSALAEGHRREDQLVAGPGS